MKRSDDWISELHYQETLGKVSEPEYFYWEGDKVVMTEEYHLKRGSCCGSGCKHCPYWPPHQKLNKEVRKDLSKIK